MRERSGGDIKLVSSIASNQQHTQRYGLKSLQTHVYITVYQGFFISCWPEFHLRVFFLFPVSWWTLTLKPILAHRCLDHSCPNVIPLSARESLLSLSLKTPLKKHGGAVKSPRGQRFFYFQSWIELPPSTQSTFIDSLLIVPTGA